MFKKTALGIALATTVLALGVTNVFAQTTQRIVGSGQRANGSSDILSSKLGTISFGLMSGKDPVPAVMTTVDSGGEPHMQMVYVRFNKLKKRFEFFLSKKGSALSEAKNAPVAFFIRSHKNPADYVTFTGDAVDEGAGADYIRFSIRPDQLKIITAETNKTKVNGNTEVIELLDPTGDYQLTSQYDWDLNVLSISDKA